ncbi:hypothetical protein Tco_0266898 [Tanacetum coccineum]
MMFTNRIRVIFLLGIIQPDVKDVFATISKEESHRGLQPGNVSAKHQHVAFVIKSNNVLKEESIITTTITEIIDFGINQHLNVSTKNVFNFVDISNLIINVSHDNRTLAKITPIGTLRLTDNVLLFDVLIVPRHNVSPLYVNKMIKESKIFVAFDVLIMPEYNISPLYVNKMIKESKNFVAFKHKLVGTDTEYGGIYMFDINSNDYDSKDQYAVSIKEDTTYPCLHSPKTTEDKAQYVVSRETQYAVFKIWNEYNILEDIKCGLYSKKSLIRRIELLGYAVSN